MDEEPIVGNEIVHTNVRLPPLDDEGEEDEDINPEPIVPSFEWVLKFKFFGQTYLSFDKTHQVSDIDNYNEEDTPVVNVSP